ncbi:TPA: ABC transporter ATP-binding protein, partial [Listeria monocytogenes]|nr:ABC transporter ATP-binding protein [Listeria monocytogenes]HDT9431282.1 ABC transporter ATP-binding protein [Listeria monocytogenes]HDU0823431.1 ABC transporter ATP-binding protein [Listeria monocytogenes]HDU0934522.1 ABC transporter ATP-binding protein [Listeria monocytogenes]
MARNKFDIDEELETAFSAAHLKRILVYVKPYQKSIYITLFVILLANVATMIGPYLTKIVIDDTIPNKNMTQLFWIAVIFIVSVIVTGLCMRYRI